MPFYILVVCDVINSSTGGRDMICHASLRDRYPVYYRAVEGSGKN